MLEDQIILEQKEAIKSIREIETFVKDYYTSLGYNVVFSSVVEKTKGISNIPFPIIKLISGLPDLFVYNKTEFFFVEVKSGLSPLSDTQKVWIKEHPSYKVFVVRVVSSFFLDRIPKRFNKKKLKAVRP